MIKKICKDLKYYFKIVKMNDRWRKVNKHNFTTANTIFPIDIVSVGNFTYGKLNVHYFGGTNEKLQIGNFCSIADEVHFLTGGNHNYNVLMTYPFKNKFNKIREAISKGNIIIGDDVWIGYGSTILSGVNIGKGAVVAAGSIVSKDIPPYAIYAGNRIIKYRFSDNIIKKLLKIDFNDFDKEFVSKKIETLYTEINEENIDLIIREVMK